MTTKEDRTGLATGDEAEALRELFPRGSTVYLVLRSRSASNYSRVIGVLSLGCARAKGAPCAGPATWGRHYFLHPNCPVAAVLGMRVNAARDGVRVSGVGHDAGQYLVSYLSQKLYGDNTSLNREWL